MTKKPKMVTPDAKELMSLKETEHLFLSNLFRLQLESLTEQITAPKAKSIEGFLHLLRAELLDLTSRELKDFSKEFPKLAFRQEDLHPFEFKAPKVSVVGSYLLGTVIKSSLNIDLNLEIPAE